VLVGSDGSPVAVEEVFDENQYETVYNLRVADHHTYFVGCDEWGFSVWAHNADCTVAEVAKAVGKKNAQRLGDKLESVAELVRQGKVVKAQRELEKMGVNVDSKRVRQFIASKTRYTDPFGERPVQKDMPQKVWDASKNKDGKVFDPKTGKELFWNPDESRMGQWHMGHLPGKSYKELHRKFMAGEISYKEFTAEVRNVGNYFAQEPGPNLGRLFD
jgi:hypothetical protein